MSRARASHSSILLDNGKILIVGGSDESNELHDALELYDPEANGGQGQSTYIVEALAFARAGSSLSKLQDGSIWIYGGYGFNWWSVLDSWAIYHP